MFIKLPGVYWSVSLKVFWQLTACFVGVGHIYYPAYNVRLAFFNFSNLIAKIMILHFSRSKCEKF